MIGTQSNPKPLATVWIYPSTTLVITCLQDNRHAERTYSVDYCQYHKDMNIAQHYPGSKAGFILHARRHPAQMSTPASACASPLHSASCAVDKSINTQTYASVYVPMQNNMSALGDLGVLSWLAGIAVLVCAGFESSTCLNFDGDSRHMPAYALAATGNRSINSCADSRRMLAYTCAWSINPDLLVYKATDMLTGGIQSITVNTIMIWI